VKNNILILLGVLALIAAGGSAAYVLTRGFRNNNPGNLEYGTPWQGVIGHDEQGYAIFGPWRQLTAIQAGIRAMGKDLLAKMARGLNTVRAIVAVYAPVSENPTEQYTYSVASEMNVGKDDPLGPENLYDLVSAMIYFENGQHASTVDLITGVNAALTT
jgi:hypothetical protein